MPEQAASPAQRRLQESVGRPEDTVRHTRDRKRREATPENEELGGSGSRLRWRRSRRLCSKISTLINSSVTLDEAVQRLVADGVEMCVASVLRYYFSVLIYTIAQSY